MKTIKGSTSMTADEAANFAIGIWTELRRRFPRGDDRARVLWYALGIELIDAREGSGIEEEFNAG